MGVNEGASNQRIIAVLARLGNEHEVILGSSSATVTMLCLGLEQHLRPRDDFDGLGLFGRHS